MEENNSHTESQFTPPGENKAVDFKNFKYRKQKKSRWWIPLAIIATIVLLIFIVVAGIGIFVDSLVSSKPKEVKSNSVLYLNLNYSVQEYTTMNPLEIFTNSKQPSFLEIITSINKAKDDDRIKGIYIKTGNSNLGYAKTIELNQTIERFKKSGKFVYAYLESGGEKDYMLALPAQKIFMPIESMTSIDGFGSQGLFMKGFLDRIGVNFFICGFEDFKTAAESYSSTSYSDSSRYQMKVYLNQLYELFLDAVHHYRSIDKNQVRSIVNEGLFTATEMLENGFIDAVANETNIKREIARLAFGKEYKNNKKPRLVKISDYVYSEPYKNNEKIDYDKQIAIIYASGEISHSGAQELFSQQKSVYATQFVENLHKAIENPQIKAIILRIDSPGGSVLGSEIIWQELRYAKRKKPIYASMSDVAASGGYYIAMACDTIIAHPATLTGSIGVISAIPNFSGTLAKLGITTDTITTAKNALFLNPMQPANQAHMDRFRAMSKDIYYRFVSKVAESRKMSFDKARSLAKGRVWTGADAYANHLVDCLGDLHFVMDLAKTRIGLKHGQKCQFQYYPKPDDDFNSFLKIFKPSDENDDASLAMSLRALSLKFGQKQDFMSSIYNAMPNEFREQFLYNLHLLDMACTEKFVLYTPFMYSVR